MEEKVLIKSEKYSIVTILAIIIGIGLLITIIWAIPRIHSYNVDYYGRDFVSGVTIRNSDVYSLTEYLFAVDEPWFLIPLVASVFVALIVYLGLRKCEMTVTDKRVYGIAAFGKRVDLPVDSISALSIIGVLRGISVATSSGKISFFLIKNYSGIHKILNDILIERQNEKRSAPTITNITNTDEADKLKKFKDLLDSGVITQEEFDAKKKQLLGL